MLGAEKSGGGQPWSVKGGSGWNARWGVRAIEMISVIHHGYTPLLTACPCVLIVLVSVFYSDAVNTPSDTAEFRVLMRGAAVVEAV